MTDIRIWRASTKVSAETVRQYGELSGDDNAIHTDPAAATAAGLAAPVAHGILTVGIALGHAQLWLTEIGARITGYDTRFVSPVFVGAEPTRVDFEGRLAADGRLDLAVNATYNGSTKPVLRPMRVYFDSSSDS